MSILVPTDLLLYSNFAGSLSTKTEISRYKPLEKKDTSHPPVTYRTLARTGTSRSRDPSPVTDKSSSDSYNYNRLYPRPYTRSVSRERTDSTSSTTIPKYSGRSSITKEELKFPLGLTRERTESTSSTTSRYSGRASLSKDDIPKYSIGLNRERTESGSTIPKFTGKSSIGKEDLTKYQLGKTSRNTSREDLARYKSTSRTASREDLSKPTQKYITSRFLPKNSVEKSYTSYRPSTTAKSSEISRKNRELLNVLNTQTEDKSRPVSRCSSIAPEDRRKENSSKEEKIEMETVMVVTRSTSPNPPSQINIQRTRRLDLARLVEKQITRPVRRGSMIDKEIQSDRLDDSTKYSRFAGASRISATPWSSYLDLKYSSPSNNSKYSKDSSQTDDMSEETQNQIDESDSVKSISRNNSAKSLSQSPSRSEPKGKESKSASSLNNTKLKSKLTPPKSMDKKKLPPQIPKSESPTKVGALHSLNTPNKDFRKSVLNMNPDGKPKKLTSSNSESESSEATETSTNTKSSKLPQRSDTSLDGVQKSRRSCTRSPSTTSESSSATTSSSEDDSKSKSSKLKKLQSGGSSRTSMISADELSLDKSPKPPVSPRNKEGIKTESEAKSFLMRALAPVANLFKPKQDLSDKVNWMDSSSENVSELNSNSCQISEKVTSKLDQDSKEVENKNIIKFKRIESGEKAWWLESNESTTGNSETSSRNPQLEEGASRENAFWLLNSENEEKGNENAMYNIRHIDSGERAWWMNSNENINNTNYEEEAERNNKSEERKKYKICHVKSGDKAWWLDSENSQNKTSSEEKPKYSIRPIESGEKAWWIGSDNQKGEDSDASESEDEIPLGDRASPEGLEMPKEEEQGRISPYDNIPLGEHKLKRPNHIPLFISRHTNIDDILGGSGQLFSPLMSRIFNYQDANKTEEEFEEVDQTQVRIHDSTAQHGVIQPGRM